MAVSRSYYNRTNGNQWDVGTDVFSHTPGDLASYPRYAEVEGLLDGFQVLGVSRPPATVNEGTGFKEIELEFSAEVTIGGSLTLFGGFEYNECITAFCYGAEGSVSGTVFAETTLSAGTIISSSVSAIPGDLHAEHQYQYGLFSYLRDAPVEGTLRVPFVVVNYYVD